MLLVRVTVGWMVWLFGFVRLFRLVCTMGPELWPCDLHLGYGKGSAENVAGPARCNSTALTLLVESP